MQMKCRQTIWSFFASDFLWHFGTALLHDPRLCLINAEHDHAVAFMKSRFHLIMTWVATCSFQFIQYDTTYLKNKERFLCFQIELVFLIFGVKIICHQVVFVSDLCTGRTPIPCRGERIVFLGPNTNTNIIRVHLLDLIRIRILFGLRNLTEYEYEYHSERHFWSNLNTNT